MRVSKDWFTAYQSRRNRAATQDRSREKKKPECPREDDEQRRVIEWRDQVAALGTLPGIERLYHTPNGGKRSKAEAGKFKALGVSAGVPDLCWPVRSGGWPGLHIEMKRAQGGRLSQEQRDWVSFLAGEGYAVAVAHGADAAIKLIQDYANGAWPYEWVVEAKLDKEGRINVAQWVREGE